MRTYCAVSIYTYMLCSGKETAAVAVNNLVQSLSLSLSGGCFVFLRYRRTRIGIQPAAAGVQGKGREGKGREGKGGVAEGKPNRPVRTGGGRAFRERGERKLVSSVDRRFCFPGHFANDERKKEIIHWLLKV